MKAATQTEDKITDDMARLRDHAPQLARALRALVRWNRDDWGDSSWMEQLNTLSTLITASENVLEQAGVIDEEPTS